MQDFQPSNWRRVSETSSESPTQATLPQEMPPVNWRCFMTGTKVNFPDEDNWTWRTVGDIDCMEDILADLFQDGLRVVDYERTNAKYNENSVCWLFNYTITWFKKIVFSSISGCHAFITRDRPCWERDLLTKILVFKTFRAHVLCDSETLQLSDLSEQWELHGQFWV